MKICMFGLPGSGKGLYSQMIEEITGCKQLSTGDLLRQIKLHDQTEIGDKVRALGPTDYADDLLIINAIKEELKKDDYINGVIFDGFPRTLKQAEKMIEMGLIPDAILEIECSPELIKERVAGRRIHLNSGRVYHTTNKPPKIEGVDDLTGEPLIIREDDKPEFMDKRFSDFNILTQPALDFLKAKCKYGSGPVLIKISGEIPINEAENELKIGLFSTKSIHKIRKEHIFNLVTMAYDVDNKNHDDIILREALHQSLMKGEIPFSSEIFYFQKNLLDPKNSKHNEIIDYISKEVLLKCQKLTIIYKEKQNKAESFLKTDSGFYFSDSNLSLISIANENKIEISLVNSNQYEKLLENKTNKQIQSYIDQTVSIDFNKDHINTGESLNKMIEKKEMIEVLSPSPFVIIESSYAGNQEEIIRNENYARAAVISCIEKGEIPFASHLLYTQKGILDDTKSAQRRLGIESGLLFGKICDKSVMYSDLGMTDGMNEGIEKAEKLGRSVEIRSIPDFDSIFQSALDRIKKSTKIKL